MRFPTFFFALLLPLATLAATPRVSIEIEGLSGEQADAARDNMELQQFLEREVSATQLGRLVERGREQIRKALEPYGYYDAQVESDLAQADGQYRAIYKVTPGERVMIRAASVTVNGPGSQFGPVASALRAFVPKVGAPLEHGPYEASKANVTAVLQGAGYFDAQLDRHRVEVTRAARSADLDVSWNSGERYRIGAVHFAAAQFPEEFLQGYLPWRPDAYYDVEELLALQQRLVDADYFTSVSVQPELEKRADGHVPVDVLLVPAKRTIYTANAYLSTDSGPGAGFGVQRRWINSRGHKAGGEIDYSARLQAIGTYYRIPVPGRQLKSFNFAAGYRDETTDSSRSRLMRLSANEVRDRWHGHSRTLGLQYLNGDFTVAYEPHNSSLLYAEMLLARKRADDLMFPSHGVSVTYSARLAAEQLLSDTSLASVRADAKWVRPAGSKSRFILRASLGALAASDFEALPPDLRFFAGGDRSVRGFDYQQIGERRIVPNPEPGPPDTIEGVIGGRHLIAISGEIEHYFLPRWGAAVFVDAGDAYNSSPDANVGAGIGLRWKSPVGVVRVDFAVPVSTEFDDAGLRFHIMIGPDL
ncbi:MAG: autotransporter assembly complex family protein [Steroidobacteraceae bacterium]